MGNIGHPFDNASRDLLEELFRQWGFQIQSKQQHPGTEHGFEIFFRISEGKFPLHVYVECKASESFNEIEVEKLFYKIRQLKWSGFTHKDIHIFFSGTVSILFRNKQTTI